MQIDKTGWKILEILQENARLSNAEIARLVGLTTSAVQDRVKKLEARGIILGYTTRVNPAALDLTLTAFVGVRISPHHLARQVGSALAATPGIEEVYRQAGDECFLIKARCRDTAQLEGLLDNINDTEGVVGTRTTIALSPVTEANGAILAAHRSSSPQEPDED